ncbi:toxin-antitoxin system antitoxin subunit [Actinotignum schaalii]|uniref:toxin-antitoxin system antitoxin subunit n=1 Tax=Actinotignum schaalii TaxID=59505 RepID=UPI00041C23AB|nr:toxin-antitoxin system antitoxin subunit [Actinotignum schaalii]WQN45337.1 hypothetical protein U4A90_01170 [Actinotignum schaalii]
MSESVKYNSETLEAMQEARDIMSGKIQAEAYASVKDFFEALNAEDGDSPA